MCCTQRLTNSKHFVTSRHIPEIANTQDRLRKLLTLQDNKHTKECRPPGSGRFKLICSPVELLWLTSAGNVNTRQEILKYAFKLPLQFCHKTFGLHSLDNTLNRSRDPAHITFRIPKKSASHRGQNARHSCAVTDLPGSPIRSYSQAKHASRTCGNDNVTRRKMHLSSIQKMVASKLQSWQYRTVMRHFRRSSRQAPYQPKELR